jgi:membrane fusion protein
MSSDLFRPEVMQARAGQWLGGVRLNTSLPWWGVTAAAALLAGVLISYAFVGQVTRKAHVSGVLVPAGGQMDLHAAPAGRVAELRVGEGQAVRQGDVVMVLTLDRATGASDVGAQVAQHLCELPGHFHRPHAGADWLRVRMADAEPARRAAG